MKTSGVTVIFIIFCLAVYAQPYPYEQSWGQVKQLFDNITGTWQVDGKQQFEKWEYDNGAFIGKAFTMSEGDTIVDEYLRVYAEVRKVYYEATVPGQNRGVAIRFHLASCRDNRIEFRNPGHDFPQRITYELPDKNNLKATISNIRQSEDEPEKVVEIRFTRVN